MLTLIIGGARSGKSRFAQSLASESSRVAYIATARPESAGVADPEMAARIARHRSERPPEWITVEEPLEIARAVERCADDCNFIVLDCLTLWLSNLFWDRSGDQVHEAAMREVALLPQAAGSAHLAVVTNEVGCGLVPESPLGRSFRDVHGWMNQEAARAADSVYHVVAGIPVAIKKGAEVRV
jgi:adenosylcobinamide kinase / adenosylcobinamide-phosphate guanylyltransferase